MFCTGFPGPNRRSMGTNKVRVNGLKKAPIVIPRRQKDARVAAWVIERRGQIIQGKQYIEGVEVRGAKTLWL